MAKPNTTVIGTYLSPYTRKVLVTLDLKGIEYEIDPMLAFYGNDEFEKLSPVRRIPVLVDDLGVVRDSTIICEYLEDRYPEPSVHPKDPMDAAHARWLEEYADTRIQEVFMVHYFNNIVLNKMVWNEPPDEEVLKRAKEEEIPRVLNHLERELPEEGLLFDTPGLDVADITLGAFFRSMELADFRIDSDRWPITAAFVDRVLAYDSFTKLRPFEEAVASLPVSEHRDALIAAGAPVTKETLATDEARRGFMVIK